MEIVLTIILGVSILTVVVLTDKIMYFVLFVWECTKMVLGPVGVMINSVEKWLPRRHLIDTAS